MAPENGDWADATVGALLLQWGRGRMAPENSASWRTVAARSLLQWGRGRMAPENLNQLTRWSAALRRFNGAGAGWPRKTRQRR